MKEKNNKTQETKDKDKALYQEKTSWILEEAKSPDDFPEVENQTKES